MNRKIFDILACVTAFFSIIYLIALSVYKVISSSNPDFPEIPGLFFVLGIFLLLAPLICWIVSAIMSCVNFKREIGYRLAYATITIGIVNDILVVLNSTFYMIRFYDDGGDLLVLSLAISLIHLICTLAGLIAHCMLSNSRLI